MQEITISTKLSSKISELELSCIECDIVLEDKSDALWNEIQNKIVGLNANLAVDKISKIPAVASARRAYKACGKAPARYRVSAEALLRRVLKRNEIYQVNNVVDLLNMVSISTGFSIGGYDADKINGAIEFGIGEKDEPYEGIGRGKLNIEFMPVFRDKLGAFGTSTSDSIRTCVNNKTKRFLMIIVNYGGASLPLATEMAVVLLKNYAGTTNIELKNIK